MKEREWQKIDEVGSSLAFFFMYIFLRYLPHFLTVLAAVPVSFFYYISSSRVRHSLDSFKVHIRKLTGKKIYTYLSVLSFSIALIGKGESWTGRIKPEWLEFEGDHEEFVRDMESGKGSLLLVSHLGSTEELRALSESLLESELGKEREVVSIADFDVASHFNKMISTLNKNAKANVMSIRNMDLGSISYLDDVIKSGGMVVIAGDRSGGRNIRVSFLGEDASFPFGAFDLQLLLSAPSYFVTLLRKKTFSFRRRYVVTFKKNSVFKAGYAPRSERMALSEKSALEYARFLEKMTLSSPYQWYNFYDFWRKDDND